MWSGTFTMGGPGTTVTVVPVGRHGVWAGNPGEIAVESLSTQVIGAKWVPHPAPASLAVFGLVGRVATATWFASSSARCLSCRAIFAPPIATTMARPAAPPSTRGPRQRRGGPAPEKDAVSRRRAVAREDSSLPSPACPSHSATSSTSPTSPTSTTASPRQHTPTRHTANVFVIMARPPRGPVRAASQPDEFRTRLLATRSAWATAYGPGSKLANAEEAGMLRSGTALNGVGVMPRPAQLSPAAAAITTTAAAVVAGLPDVVGGQTLPAFQYFLQAPGFLFPGQTATITVACAFQPWVGQPIAGGTVLGLSSGAFDVVATGGNWSGNAGIDPYAFLPNVATFPGAISGSSINGVIWGNGFGPPFGTVSTLNPTPVWQATFTMPLTAVVITLNPVGPHGIWYMPPTGGIASELTSTAVNGAYIQTFPAPSALAIIALAGPLAARRRRLNVSAGRATDVSSGEESVSLTIADPGLRPRQLQRRSSKPPARDHRPLR